MSIASESLLVPVIDLTNTAQTHPHHARQIRRLGAGVILTLLLSLLLMPVRAQEAPAEPEDPQPRPRPQPVQTLSADGLTANLYFGALTQGQVGLVHLTGDGIRSARALLRTREYEFQPGPDGWYTLVVADIDAVARDYPLSILAQREDGQLSSLEARLTINAAGFLRQGFSVPADRAFLTDPEVERYEFARIDLMTLERRPDWLWEPGGFQLPIGSDFTSGFGQYRILNQNSITRHTGWDQRAPVGTPVGAMAGGEVVFAGQLDIRGNYVLIDHGWGVYSGYAHLSQINVAVGQMIERGQLLGLSGNTGRSSGPHLHWEINVHGEWVDGVAFLEMWLPGT